MSNESDRVARRDFLKNAAAGAAAFVPAEETSNSQASTCVASAVAIVYLTADTVITAKTTHSILTIDFAGAVGTKNVTLNASTEEATDVLHGSTCVPRTVAKGDRTVLNESSEPTCEVGADNLSSAGAVGHKSRVNVPSDESPRGVSSSRDVSHAVAILDVTDTSASETSDKTVSGRCSSAITIGDITAVLAHKTSHAVPGSVGLPVSITVRHNSGCGVRTD